jgi:2-hydroxycyclohexanecarboxyl-CoA dehydrogenase
MGNGKVALITGASGGMGLATVRRLVRDGYRIIALDLNAEPASGLLAELKADGRAYQVDLTDEQATRKVIGTAEKEVGPVDALVNMVGWTKESRFVDETSDYWKKLIAVNFLSALYVTHSVLPGMIERKSGRIVNVTSDAERVGSGHEAVYAGTKGGLTAWSKSIARELARFNINVNCTAPGPTNTPLEQAADPEVVAKRVKAIPFRRWAVRCRAHQSEGFCGFVRRRCKGCRAPNGGGDSATGMHLSFPREPRAHVICLERRGEFEDSGAGARTGGGHRNRAL